MKNKNIVFFAFFFLSLFLFACNQANNDVDEEEANGLIEEAHAWVESNVKEGVAESFKLPTAYPEDNRVSIEWYSGDPFFMDNEGNILDRPTSAQSVYFEYVISAGDTSKSFEKTFKLSPKTLEDGEKRFLGQISDKITRNIDFSTSYYGVINVTWWSSNQDVFTNEGVYIKPESDTEITISYVVSDGNSSIENSINVIVQGKTTYDFFMEAQAWLESGFITDRYITKDLELPTHVGNNEDIQIVWTSTNENIISNDGKIHKTIYERYVTLKAKLVMGSSLFNYEYNLVVEALDITNMSDEEMLEHFVNNIAVDEFTKLVFNAYSNNTQSYGYIHFYGSNPLHIEEAIIPESNSNRPGTVAKNEFVVVHDTANTGETADAAAHYRYVLKGGDGTSWHYSIDENGAYHQIPDNEVAWHAGDSTRKFELMDTGIKATAKLPIVTLVDGYYYINGQNTKIRPYTDKEGTKFDTTNWTTDYINQMGILVEIGENGNWYMNKSWYNKSYDLIGNFGGNYNGIGIESCVNYGSDYTTTVRNLAQLVAKLCVENNLPVSRVQGHHFFAGKYCPNQIMAAGYWYEFLNLVSLEKFAKEHFADYTFNWTSLSPNVNEIGKISLNAQAGDEISYKVSIVNKGNAEVFNGTYTTILK